MKCCSSCLNRVHVTLRTCSQSRGDEIFIARRIIKVSQPIYGRQDISLCRSDELNSDGRVYKYFAAPRLVSPGSVFPGARESVSEVGYELNGSVFLNAEDAEAFAEVAQRTIFLCVLCEKLCDLCDKNGP